MASWLERAVEAYGGAEAAEKKARELGVSDSQINAFKNAYNNSSNTSSDSDDDSYSAPAKSKAATQPSSSSQGKVVDGRYVYGDDSNYAGSTGKKTASTAKTGGAYGTASSGSIDKSNPWGGNVTKFDNMSEAEFRAYMTDALNFGNWNGLDMQAARDHAEYVLGDHGLATTINDTRDDKIDSQGLAVGHEVWNPRTERWELKSGAKPPTLQEGTPGYYPDDAYDWLYNAAERSRDERTKTIEDYYKNQTDQARAEYEYAIWKGIQELNNALENGKTRYNEAVAQNAIQSLQEADNLALRNAAAGNMGGIGGKLYSDQQASFDAQLGNIRNEELRLYNETEQQAALLEAQGRFEEATAVRQIGAQRLQSLLNLQSELWNAGREDYKWLYNYGMNYQQQARGIEQQAMQNALTRLQLGILGPDDFSALGVSPEDAQGLADYYKQLANLNLEQAKLSLQADMAKLAGYSPSASGGGTGSGVGGGGGGNQRTPGGTKTYAGYSPYEAFKTLAQLFGSTQDTAALAKQLEYGALGKVMGAADANELAQMYVNYINTYGFDENGNLVTVPQAGGALDAGLGLGGDVAAGDLGGAATGYDDGMVAAGPMSFNDIPGLSNSHGADWMKLADDNNKVHTINPQQLAQGLADGTIYRDTSSGVGVLYRMRTKPSTGGFQTLYDLQRAYQLGAVTDDDYRTFSSRLGMDYSKQNTGGYTLLADLIQAKKLGMVSKADYDKWSKALNDEYMTNKYGALTPNVNSPTGGYPNVKSLEAAYKAGLVSSADYLNWMNALMGYPAGKAGYVAGTAGGGAHDLE